jgi:hypothetical protein
MDKGGLWLAHCLECDLMCSGDSYSHAMERMKSLLAAHLAHGMKEGSNMLQNAPLQYWPIPDDRPDTPETKVLQVLDHFEEVLQHCGDNDLEYLAKCPVIFERIQDIEKTILGV